MEPTCLHANDLGVVSGCHWQAGVAVSGREAFAWCAMQDCKKYPDVFTCLGEVLLSNIMNFVWSCTAISGHVWQPHPAAALVHCTQIAQSRLNGSFDQNRHQSRSRCHNIMLCSLHSAAGVQVQAQGGSPIQVSRRALQQSHLGSC